MVLLRPAEALPRGGRAPVHGRGSGESLFMIAQAKQAEAMVKLTKRTLENGEQRWEMDWPRGVADPRMESFHFPSGISLVLYELYLTRPLSLRFSVCAETTFAMSFVVSGRTWYRYDRHGTGPSELKAPYSLFYDLYDHAGVSYYDSTEPVRCLVVYFDLEVLHRVLGDQMRLLPEVEQRPARKWAGLIQRKVVCTPAMRLATHQALGSSAKDPHGRLFVESKGLELMGLFMLGLARQKGQGGYAATDYIAPNDREKLHAARDILVGNLAKPPCIADLSRQVGLNECKLKSLFKNHFQNTIYGYVQAERMRRAKTLLEQGMTVSQTASTLGYVNFSHFAAAFRKHHGATPSACKRHL